MTSKKNKWIIGITAFALTGLILLQVTWMLQSAKLKEAQFDHRVSMALDMVREGIKNDTILDEIPKITTNDDYITIKAHLDTIQIDSMILKAFHYHRIYLPYQVEFITKCSKTCSKNSTYRCGLCSDLKANYEMRIHFEGKTFEIWQSMAPLLLISAVLILLMSWGYLRLIKLLWKQHRLHEISTDFVNNMAHELKTPISTISLAVKMLRKSGHDLNLQTEYLDRLEQENERLKSHTNRILNVSQLGRKASKQDFHTVDLSELVHKVVALFKLRLQANHVNLTEEIASEITVVGHASSLEIAISNLLDNAIKYGDKTAPAVVISLHGTEDFVVLSIEDNGIGIPKAYQRQVFDKYFRVPRGNKHDQKGFGLGLTLVKGILEAHDATITTQSKPGAGTTFTIRFQKTK